MAHLEYTPSRPIPPGKKLIAIEGVDGSGKTTVSKRLAACLGDAGVRVYWTCEPTYSGAGALIRERLGLYAAGELLAPLMRAELAALFAADRLKHWQDILTLFEITADIVITDRWTPSSLVYQGYKDRMAWWAINLMNREAPVPTKTFVLDVPAELAHARARARGTREPFALEEITTFAETYRSLPRLVSSAGKSGPHKIEVVDATRPVEVIVDDLLARLDGC